jgi:hypothetical protein
VSETFLLLFSGVRTLGRIPVSATIVRVSRCFSNGSILSLVQSVSVLRLENSSLSFSRVFLSRGKSALYTLSTILFSFCVSGVLLCPVADLSDGKENFLVCFFGYPSGFVYCFAGYCDAFRHLSWCDLGCSGAVFVVGSLFGGLLGDPPPPFVEN